MDSLFKRQVLEIIRLIPRGRVTSYGAIAKAMGYPNHARQVGNALSSYDKTLPAHRVLNASGRISLPSCVERFTEKLESEGVKMKNGRVENFREVFWDPQSEL